MNRAPTNSIGDWLRSFANWLRPVAMLASLGWGAGLGYFHAGTAICVVITLWISAASVWMDRAAVLSNIPPKPAQSHPLARTLGIWGGVLAIYSLAAAVSTALGLTTYLAVSVLHRISN